MSGFTLKETLITIGVLITGLVITVASVLQNRNSLEESAIRDFKYACNQIQIRIETRLEEHAQLLRSGKGLLAVSDSVTMDEWRQFYESTRIAEFMPGIQGFGYTVLLKPHEIEDYEARLRKVYHDFKPDFTVYPKDPPRDEYTSITYLQPHDDRNRQALGFDMFSEPVRRRAMETSRDSNIAMLTGKVILVQEIDEDVQPGVLMYTPVYHRGMPAGTVEERRAALKGWVYSPYRMKDLMQGILTSMPHVEQEPLSLSIYDDTTLTTETLLFDSREAGSAIPVRPNLHYTLLAEFRGRKWSLVFNGRKDELSFFHRSQIILWFTGLLITILLFILSLMQIRANVRARQIEELNGQLESLNADKDRFIAILSHDLKSPFTSILGFLELLINGIRKYSIDQIESHIYTINDAARNTYHLLEDLLMWTRAHSGKIPFNPSSLDLATIMHNVCEVLVPSADAKEIKVECPIPPNLKVRADQDMLKAIMRNLLSNAIKFTAPGGTVKVSAEHKGNISVISVSDNGLGIPQERIPSLFDISKISPTKGTSGEKGTGLGLVLCREFIETHGGTITVESEPGRGSNFIFTLPD